jgi:hypothetical protein
MGRSSCAQHNCYSTHLCKRETNEEQFVIVWEEHKHHDKDKVRIIAKVLHPQKTFISSRKIPAQNLCIMNMPTSS